MVMALTGKNRARWFGKHEAAAIFSEWLAAHWHGISLRPRRDMPGHERIIGRVSCEGDPPFHFQRRILIGSSLQTIPRSRVRGTAHVA